MIHAGDYDYEDGHDMPAGCQYMVSPPQPDLASAGVRSNVSAPVPASGSAVVAKTVPLEASAPGTQTVNTYFNHNASAPAPMRAPRSSTASFVAQEAALKGTRVGSQAETKLLCKPIAARGDPRHLSDDQVAFIIFGAFAGTGLLIICCISCCEGRRSSSEDQGTKENTATIALEKEEEHQSSLDMVE